MGEEKKQLSRNNIPLQEARFIAWVTHAQSCIKRASK